MLNCKEMVRLVASDELAAATWWRKVIAHLHLAMCRHCKRYQVQIHSMAEPARKVLHAEDDPEAIERLKQRILSRTESGETGIE